MGGRPVAEEERRDAGTEDVGSCCTPPPGDMAP